AHLQPPQGFAIALGRGHAEISQLALLCITPLLMPDDGHRHAMKAREPTHDRRVVGGTPVAVDVDKALDEPFDKIQRVRPLGMSRQLPPFESRGSGYVFLIRRHYFS